jgi:hypothetical protein
MKPRKLTKIVSWATGILAVMLVLLPFHATLTVWVSSFASHYTLLRLWKEILLLLLVPLAVVVLWRVPKLRHQLEIGWLFWAIVFYALLHILLGGLALMKHQVTLTAFADAVILNLRFLLIFLLALVFATQSEWLKIHWRQLLLWPAAAVVTFGLLQIFVLPVDFLRHFGYGVSTIMPFETVDQKLSYVRIQSTLRGANPLGAYLVLIVGALVVALLRKRLVLSKRVSGLLFLLGSLLVLGATYSRSAYLGLFVTVLALLWVVAHQAQKRRWVVGGLTIVCVLLAGVFVGFRDNDRFQNTFFHSDEHSASLASSNASRGSAMLDGLHDVVTEPFGKGPGTAGPASAHNTQDAPRIAENYYLQIGQEVGWLGIALFVAISYMVVKRLWRRRADPLARTLLVSFFGISLINLMSHAWTDDTLSLIWWGFAGVALAPAILPTINKAHGNVSKQTKKQKTVVATN